jgi:flagellar M-ring protein FliF
VEFLRQFVNGLLQAWRRLSASARINIGLAAAVTIAIIVVVTVMGARPQFVRLYGDLELEEAAQIQSYLSEQGIPFQLEQGGGTILVPLQSRTQARVALAAQGLPTTQGAAPGFELFDRQDLMTNQWLQDVNYMRAVQGALQRQLNEFEFVRQSFVFIREAPQELFVSEQRPSEAAVTLDVSRPLTKSEVKAILSVVSSFGGTNLHTGNVTLTTTAGDVLHLPASDEFASIANSKLEYIAELEQQRQARAQEALAQLGKRSIVRVSADVDFDHIKEVQQQYVEGPAVSTWSREESTVSAAPTPEGPPGATSNLPGGAAGGAGAVGSETSSVDTVENFEPSVTTTERVSEPGTVQRYRVSAFIEGNYEPEMGEDGEPTGDQAYVPLSDEEITRYQDFIAAAVGVGVTAGDISVFDHPFELERLADARTPATEALPGTLAGRVVQFGEIAAKLALILVGFWLVRRLLNRAIVPMREMQVGEVPEATPEDRRRQEIADEVERLSREQPDTVAALLRTWMSEEE